MFERKKFAEMLISLRTGSGLTQSQVAEAVDGHKQYVSRWEKCQGEPTLTQLYALADYFNVSIDYLVGRTDNPEINR